MGSGDAPGVRTDCKGPGQKAGHSRPGNDCFGWEHGLFSFRLKLFGVEDLPLNGNERATFIGQFRALQKEWDRLRKEYD